jgi:late competence protein required for DNA uptake (superfamily II DNA/RNA helicase)
VIDEELTYREDGYICSRCGGMFATYPYNVLQCPYCAMLCDEVACRIIGSASENEDK